ncbi:olfactory receptor 14J1-like [Notechis scutatus]|uniref:Olfactory receptor 14J1-like n=1 Tax=Notechis scutatus TaxID=8663 RepID=A0A6J1VSL9_9SAUR|nr:olfactory receptor 14J1-like [Notechis scutatus]
MSNLTSASGFLLLKFSQVRELQILYFFLFLAVYLITLLGNLFTIISIVVDHHLHTPMYFFLMNLAIIDIGSISSIVPKSMFNSLGNNSFISYFECVVQVFFFFFFDASEFSLLTVMAHDRHVAIYNPLQYETIMNSRTCIKMVAMVWLSGFLYAILHTSSTFSITFCSNEVDQFFCEIPKLLKLSCSDLYLVEGVLLVVSCNLAFGCFIFIIISYVWIFRAILQIRSVQGRQKALSTCLPHLIVVSVFICIGFFVYARPPSNSSSYLDLVFSIIYVIFPPMMNPFIYSIRNKEFQNALCKFLNLGQLFHTFPGLF